eukprot:TRINITY_DN46691_c0_g1_i1.p1 TRINITY_DN46691_c0_g1~~TRINITY_DN46691_c0_g1_i1.p1  ORF type:complete len:305 (+),score=78.02 TRINITY_DN46691_c0_g1_i1:677-1591(+)
MILSSTAMALSPSSRAPDTGHMMGTSSQPVRATTRPAPHPTSLLPSLCQPSSDTFLSPTPLPCMPDTMDTDPSSLCSSPDIPMTVSEQSHSSSTSLPIMSSVMDSRPNLTTDTELLSLSSNPAIRVSAMNGTADMLTSQLLSVADDPVYLDEDPCSVDWLCVPSHRISMDTPTTAKIQSPSTLMLYFSWVLLGRYVICQETTAFLPPKPHGRQVPLHLPDDLPGYEGAVHRHRAVVHGATVHGAAVQGGGVQGDDVYGTVVFLLSHTAVLPLPVHHPEHPHDELPDHLSRGDALLDHPDELCDL